MNSHDFKFQVEEVFDDLALLQIDAYWVDCEQKTNFLAQKFAQARPEIDLRDTCEHWAPAIATFPLLMIQHLRGVYIARRAQIRAASRARAVNSGRARLALAA